MDKELNLAWTPNQMMWSTTSTTLLRMKTLPLQSHHPYLHFLRSNQWQRWYFLKEPLPLLPWVEQLLSVSLVFTSNFWRSSFPTCLLLAPQSLWFESSSDVKPVLENSISFAALLPLSIFLPFASLNYNRRSVSVHESACAFLLRNEVVQEWDQVLHHFASSLRLKSLSLSGHNPLPNQTIRQELNIKAAVWISCIHFRHLMLSLLRPSLCFP